MDKIDKIMEDARMHTFAVRTVFKKRLDEVIQECVLRQVDIHTYTEAVTYTHSFVIYVCAKGCVDVYVHVCTPVLMDIF